jgi:hypothetical protein
VCRASVSHAALTSNAARPVSEMLQGILPSCAQLQHARQAPLPNSPQSTAPNMAAAQSKTTLT